MMVVDVSRQQWIQHKGIFENMIKGFLELYPKAVFVNIGANIGIHSLCAAAMHHKVWAIDTLPKNVAILYLSAAVSGILKHMKLFRNDVDSVKGFKSIRTGSEYIGVSFFEHDNNSNGYKTVHTFPLYDIIEYAKEYYTEQLTLIVTLGSEGFGF